jgi:hypothetical protein
MLGAEQPDSTALAPWLRPVNTFATTPSTVAYLPTWLAALVRRNDGCGLSARERKNRL